MKRLIFSLAIFAIPFSSPALATTPEAEEAYKQGSDDWNRGDPASAIPRLLKAADAGHPAAQALYAFLMDQADNDDEAAVYYRKAADQGNAEGMFGLAGLYASGDGIKADLSEARRWYTQAAELGHKQSIVVLALAHLQRGLGLGEDDMNSPVALRWLREAAQIDNIPSLRRLVEVYGKGEMGVSPDKAEADRFQKRLNELEGIDPNAKKKRRKRI